jgi:hypothetical protein
MLIAGIGTAGVASYVGLDRISLFAADDSEELSYIPGNVQLLAYVDVRRVMDSELRRKLQPDIGSKRETTQLFEETGINIETDVDSVTVALIDGAENQPPLVLARGRFDDPRIEALLRSKGGIVSEYAGVKITTVDEHDLGVAFIKPGLLAVGSPTSIRLGLDARGSGTGTVKENEEMTRLRRRVEGGHTWTVAKFEALQGRAPLPTDVVGQLPSISWFAASGRIDDGVSAVFHAEAKDEKAAQDLREVIRGFLALVRMQVGQQPDFADLVNSVELSGEGTTVSLAFSVPAQMIDRLGAIGAQRPRVPAANRRPRPFAPAPVRAASASPTI